MGGYQSVLIGLRHSIFLSLLTKGHRCLLNLIDELTAFSSFFIFQAGLHYQVLVIMLRIYIYPTDGKFLYKTGLFHAFMSHSLRVPIQIVKYVKNGHFIFGSAIKVAREAW